MRIHRFIITIVTLLALAGAVPSEAAKKKTLVLARDGLVAGTLLEAGEYKIELAGTGDSITFHRNGGEVVTAPCSVSALDRLAGGDSVYYRPGTGGAEVIRRIILVRPKLVIDLDTTGSPAGEKAIATRNDR